MIKFKDNNYITFKQDSIKYHNIARQFFEQKNKPEYYLVEGDVWQGDDYFEHEDDVCLTADEVNHLRDLSNEYEGYSFDEIKDEIPFYEKLEFDIDFTGHFVPKSVNFDKKIHYYQFSVLIKTPSNPDFIKKQCNLSLRDEEYIDLLAWRLQNRRASFNNLVSWNPIMFCDITKRLVLALGFFDELQDPFLVFMDEIDQDAYEAVGEENFKKTVCGDYRTGFVELQIQERIMEMYQQNSKQVYRYLKGINAVVLQEKFGADNYAELYERIKERFGSYLECFDEFKAFLDENTIEYTYRDGDWIDCQTN